MQRVVMFNGGADIDPSIYGEKNTGESSVSEQHDLWDLNNYERAKTNGLPCSGICRGAQLLWALSGGKICQNIIKRHCHIHALDGLWFLTNSLHHQGIILTDGKPPDGIEVLATHEGVVEAFYGTNKDGLVVLGVQGHPEMCDWWHPLHKFFYDKVEEMEKLCT